MKTNAIDALAAFFGEKAARRLRAKTAALYCWRGSSPWNWYVESKGGETLWHSGPGARIGSHVDLFELVEDSAERIAPSLVHREGGLPFKSTYRLKAPK